MGTACTSAVWTKSTLRGAKKLLLLAIADHADEFGVAWPGVDTLASMASITNRQALKHLAAMEADRHLVICHLPGRHSYYIVPAGLSLVQLISGIKRIAKRTKQRPSAVIKACKPLSKVTGVPKVEPLSKTTPPPVENDTGTPVESDRSPLSKTTPDPLMNKELDPINDPSVSAAVPDGTQHSAAIEASSTGESPKKKRKRKSSKPSFTKAQMDPMKNEIARVFDWSWDTMTPDETGQVQRAAFNLLCGKTPVDRVQHYYNYCEEKYTHFKPTALSANKSDAENWKGSRNGHAPESGTRRTGGTSAHRNGGSRGASGPRRAPIKRTGKPHEFPGIDYEVEQTTPELTPEKIAESNRHLAAYRKPRGGV